MASTCPICLDNLDLDGKVKASPDACEHVFCLPCLEKWSKLGSYCPVDRKRYKKIVNLESESVIQIKPRKRKRKRIVYDFSTTCEICVKDDYPDTLLLCDCCDLGFHCHCLTPPLETVPAGLWFCPTCVTVEEKLKQKKGITKEMELDYDVFLQKINYYQPVLPETKKQKLSTPVKSEGVQDTFNDIISVFEDINVVPDEDRNIKTELNVSIDDSKMNKMLKTFNFISETKPSNNSHVKSVKTYLHGLNVKVSKRNIHNCTQDKGNISEAFKRNFEKEKFCLNNSNACSATNCMINNGKSKPCEPKNQNENLKEVTRQIDSLNSFSEIKVRHKLSLNRKKHPLFKNSLYEEDLIFKEVNDGNHDDTDVDHDNPSLCISKKFSKNVLLEGEKLSNPDLVITLEADDQTPSSKSSPQKAIKGTFSIFSDAFVKSADSDERSGCLDLCAKNSQTKSEEKFRFSVFGEIEDISSSQEKFNNFNALAHISLSSAANLDHCSLCKDMISFTSQKLCKICKKNNPMKRSVLKNEKLLKCTKETKPCMAGLNYDYKISQNNSALSKMIYSKSCMSNFERRQYSLLCKLKKVHANK